MHDAQMLKTPPSANRLLESRAAVDLLTLPFRMTQLGFMPPRDLGKGRFVYVLPGFGAGDRSMYPLRYYLERHGFNTLGWGLGVNRAGLDKSHDPADLPWELDCPEPYRGEAGVLHLCHLMINKVRDLHRRSGRPVSLVGWSLGGTIAREVARELPGIVDNVITMGSPLLGGPKYSAAAPLLARRGLNLDWIEQEVLKRNEVPLQCRASAIFSPTDGVVDVSASVVPGDEITNYQQVDVPHLGMGINAQTLKLVLEGLC